MRKKLTAQAKSRIVAYEGKIFGVPAQVTNVRIKQNIILANVSVRDGDTKTKYYHCRYPISFLGVK